jgi:hypothetical protein
MAEVTTQWERLQHRFKDNWLGVGVSLLLAVAVGASQIDGLLKSLTSIWKEVGPQQSASLLVQDVMVRPLPHYESLVASAGTNTVFPVGATVEFDLRHDHGSEEELRVRSLDVKVEAYEPQAACPFALSGDAVYGGAQAPLRRFDVFMDNGQVAEVQRREASNGPVSTGRSSNLLKIEPAFPLSLKPRGEKVADGIESLSVEFVVWDTARYRLNLSGSYTNLEGKKTVEIASVIICRPRE